MAPVAGCLTAGGATTLSVGVVPDVDPDAAIEQNTSLKESLASELENGTVSGRLTTNRWSTGAPLTTNRQSAGPPLTAV